MNGFDLFRRQVQELRLAVHFNDEEKQVLRCFYDKRLKVRRKKVPKFFLYACLCEGLEEDKWAMKAIDVNRALTNLVTVKYLQQTNLDIGADILSSYVGTGSESFEVTATGLEVLQTWHPALGVRLKAWIAVAPPWLVLIGSVLGGVSTLWKAGEYIKHLVGL